MFIIIIEELRYGIIVCKEIHIVVSHQYLYSLREKKIRLSVQSYSKRGAKKSSKNRV